MSFPGSRRPPRKVCFVPSTRSVPARTLTLPEARHQSSRMLPRINGSRERKRTSDEIAIRTLKKGKAHRIASILDVDALRHTTGKE